MKLVTIDFETEAIHQRPAYPPRPVGVAFAVDDKAPKYFAFGHPEGNNTTEAVARDTVRDLVNSGAQLLFHNAKFDVEVLERYWGIKVDFSRVEDTLILLFLHNPHAISLGLKESAEELLGMPPEERDAVREWLVAAKIIKKTQKNAGAFICRVPGNVVAPYAKGDVARTRALYKKLLPLIKNSDQYAAYRREITLMPILLRNEQQGVRIDLLALERDVPFYWKAVEKAEEWLRKRLGDVNFESGKELAEALAKNDLVAEKDWVLTPTGQRSVSKANLTPDKIRDPRISSLLGWRSRAITCLSVFMGSWLETATQSGGVIYTNWNQVRQSQEGKFAGARTGRLSSNPNFQNIPKSFSDKNDGYKHPSFLRSLPELPAMRKYFLPDPGGVFCHRDYSQQEVRILAHFEDGWLMEQYHTNPRMDVHDVVGAAIKEISGLALERRAVKILNFGMIYGMGVGKLAENLGCSVEEAQRIRSAHRAALPGVKELEKDIKQRGASGFPVRTWGGRLYYSEPAKMIGGQIRSFEYKLLNYLIQGSGADATKQALINYDSIKRDGRFLITVHDEINISAPKKAFKRETKLLAEAMECLDFSVPLLTDGSYGPNWGELADE